LKTSRELKSNSGAFTIAIANTDASAAARQAGADLVLSKPIVPDKAKFALLACDEFLCHMKAWLPNLGLPIAGETATRSVENKSWPITQERRAGESLPVRPAQSSPSAPGGVYLPVCPAVPIFEDDFYQWSSIRTIFQSIQPSCESILTRPRTGHSRFLRSVAIGVAFVSVGYVFSQPLRRQAVATSVIKIYGRALAKTQNWLHKSDDDRRPVPSELAETFSAERVSSTTDSTHIRVVPVVHPSVPLHAERASVAPQSLRAEIRPPQEQVSAATTRTHIPESLKMLVPTVTVRSVAARLTPSLLSVLEPVDLPEDLSQKLLLQKV